MQTSFERKIVQRFSQLVLFPALQLEAQKYWYMRCKTSMCILYMIGPQ